MITIDTYTGNWQAAMNPAAPRGGACFRAAESGDAREWDDFQRVLRGAGYGKQFVRWMPRRKMNVYKVVRGAGE